MTATTSSVAWKTLAYWLLYAVVGSVILVMLLAGGGDVGGEDKQSPIRTRSKLVGVASGPALAVAILGFVLLGDPRAIPTWPRIMAYAGTPVAIALTAIAWMMIARDLRARRG